MRVQREEKGTESEMDKLSLQSHDNELIDLESVSSHSSEFTAVSETPPLQTINVVLLGETQQGKSTLIKALHEYAGLIANGNQIPGLIIGGGSVSATTSVSSYPITTKLRTYKLVDIDGREVDRGSWEANCDVFESEARPVALEDGEEVHFNFIDTPGLNDTSGRDMELMSSIIGSLAQYESINAVVYIRKTSEPFGRAFREFFTYLQRSMPNLVNGLVVAHTCFFVEEVTRIMEERGQDLSKLRKDAFRQASGLDTVHFFMDNNPDIRFPFGVVQSRNEITNFLTFLKSQRPLPVTGLRLLKTESMRNTDVFVISELRRLLNVLEKKSMEFVAKLKDSNLRAFESRREISRLERRITRIEDELEAIDNNDEIILAVKTIVQEYKILRHLVAGQIDLGSMKVEYDANVMISSVEKTAQGGSSWLSEELLGTSWRAIITAGYFRSIRGSATIYTTSAYKNAREIRGLKENLEDLEDQVAYHQSQKAREEGMMGESAEKEGKELTDSVEDCKALIQRVEQEICEMAVYPRLKPIYAIKDRLNREEVNRFVRVYDEKLADLLAGM